jgi:tetratricopeptide (TPR) repeat protein
VRPQPATGTQRAISNKQGHSVFTGFFLGDSQVYNHADHSLNAVSLSIVPRTPAFVARESSMTREPVPRSSPSQPVDSRAVDFQPVDSQPVRVSSRRWLRLVWLVAVLGLIGIGLIWHRGNARSIAAARARLAQHQPEQALAILEGLSPYGRIPPDVYLLMARAERQRGELALYETRIGRAREAGADPGQLAIEAMLFQAQLGQLPDMEAAHRQLLHAGVVEPAELHAAFLAGLLRQRRFEEAAALIGEWKTALPLDPQPYYSLGLLHRDLGWPRKAEAEFTEALRLDPRHARAAFEKAVLAMRAHRFDEAIELYRVAMTRRASDGAARVGLAKCLRMTGRVEAARDTLMPLVQPPRPNLGALAELGAVEWMAGRYEEALERIEQARAELPRHAELNYQLAQTLAALGRHDEAARPFEFAQAARRAARRLKERRELAERRPDDLELQREIAELAIDYGDPAEAATLVKRLVERFPERAEFQTLLQRQPPAAPPPVSLSPARAAPPPVSLSPASAARNGTRTSQLSRTISTLRR